MKAIVRRCCFVALAFALASVAFSCTAVSERPKLVVIVTVDQLRADYLVRFDEAFTGGFRRLLDEGLYYRTAYVEHAPTLSWPGHTTIATGSHPGTHGIVANDIIVEGSRRMMLLFDEEEQILGVPESTSFSSRGVRVSGIADWIRQADPSARAVALSTGPGLALCYGGRPQSERGDNHVYWLDPVAGRFVTSTYYRDEYPDWLERFNEEVVQRYKRSLVWENSVPEQFLSLARRDDAPYELDGEHTAFPHGIEDRYPDSSERWTNAWFYNYSPHAKEALFDLAVESIERLELGQRGTTDLLTIAIKITDRIGHDFGPFSLEQLDNVLRVDRELADFMDYLDSTIGRGQYVLALTADHGSPNVPEYDLEQGRRARRVTEEDIRNLLSEIESFIEAYSGPEDELPSAIARRLEQADFVARAMTAEDLAGTGPADHILQSYRNSYVPEYTWTYPLWTNEILGGRINPGHPGNYGVIVEFEENAQIYTARACHGSCYAYDQEVPILFYGMGVQGGEATERARTIDIAPTLAHLAGVAFSDTVDGRVLDLR